MELIAKGVNSNIQTVIVSGNFDLDAAPQVTNFNATIFTNFIPDLIVLKHYDVNSANTGTDDAFIVSSSLVDGNLLSFVFVPINYWDTAIPAAVVQSMFISQECEHHFLNKSKREYCGNFNFRIVNSVRNVPATGNYIITMVFEFIKF